MTYIFYIALGPGAAQNFEERDIKPSDTADGLETGVFQRTDFQTKPVIAGETRDIYTVDLAHPDRGNIASYITTEIPRRFGQSWHQDYRNNPNYAGLINLDTEIQTPHFFDITFPATKELKEKLLGIFTNPENPDTDPIEILGKYDGPPLDKIRIHFDEKNLSPFDYYSLQKFLQAFKDKSEKEIAKEYGADILNLYHFAKENAPEATPNITLEEISEPEEPTFKFLGEKTVLGGVGPNDLTEIPMPWFHFIARKTRLREILGEKSYVWLLNNSSKNKDYVPYIEVAKFAETDGYKRGWLYHTFYELSESDKQEIRDLLHDIQTQTYYAIFEYTKDGTTSQVLLYLDPISNFCELQVSSTEKSFQLRGFDDSTDGIWTFQTSSEDSSPIAKEILENIAAWWKEQKLTADDNGIAQKQFEVLEKGFETP